MADVLSSPLPTAKRVRVVKEKPAAMVPSAVGYPGKDNIMTDTVNETLTGNYQAATANYQAAASEVEAASTDALAQAKAGYETMNVKMTEAMEQTMKSMTEMNEFAKGNVEAMIAAAKAATAGAETLTAAVVESTKKNFEEAQEAFKAMTSAKTPNEAMQLQGDFAKAQFEKTVAAWSHMSETMLKVSGEVFQPLSNRMAVAAESVKKAIPSA